MSKTDAEAELNFAKTALTARQIDEALQAAPADERMAVVREKVVNNDVVFALWPHDSAEGELRFKIVASRASES